MEERHDVVERVAERLDVDAAVVADTLRGHEDVVEVAIGETTLGTDALSLAVSTDSQTTEPSLDRVLVHSVFMP